MTFTVVHVSDFHFKNDQPCRERLERLRDDIESQIPDNATYLIFSGDLVYAGDDNLYDNLFDDFFAPLAPRLAGIYVVPGNHDLQRNKTVESKCNSFLKDTTQSYLFKGNGAASFENPFDVFDPLENYQVLVDSVSSCQKSHFFGSCGATPDFRIVCLNSAWLGCNRADGVNDLGKLKIDTAVIDDLTSITDTNQFNIVVAHHPLEWLDEKIRQSVENRITSKFDMFLFGHVHNPSTQSGNFNGGKCLFLQGPAVKSSYSLGNNAYSIINIAPKEKRFEIKYRAFSDVRDEFVVGEDLAEGGTKYPTEDDVKYWHHIRTRTPDGLMEKFEAGLDKVDLSDWYRTNFIAKSKVIAEFVEPNISRFVSEEGPSSTGVSRLASEALEQLPHRQYVIGPQDSGLTTASFIFAKHLINNVDRLRTIPVYINAQKVSLNKAAITAEAVKTCPVRFAHSEMETLLANGQIVFICDQIGLPETEKFNRLISTFDNYFPKCRATIFAALDGGLTKAGLGSDLNFNPLDELVYQLEELTLDGIKGLIAAHNPSAPKANIERLLNIVVLSFKQMDEPIYPSSVTILLETLLQFPDFRPLNRVRLIDRYVECLLGRLEIQDIEYGVFNSSDKSNFLSYVAGHFSKNLLTSVTTKEWDEICADFSELRLVDLPSDLLKEFSEKGIILLQADRVTFRADYLFIYFVAKEMNHNSKIFDFITSDENFFSHDKELVFYGELEGVDNSKLLNTTHDRICALEVQIHETYSRNGVDFDIEWGKLISERTTGDKEEEERLVDLVHQVGEMKPSKITVEHSLQRDLLDVERRRGVTERRTVKELESRWYSAIRTYFQLVRHSNNLDAVNKMRHLKKALESSELFIKSLATKRGIIATQPIYMYSGILYINVAAVFDIEESKKDFKYMAHISFSKQLTDLLTNQQLAPAFRKLLDHESEIINYLVRSILLEIPSKENSEAFINSLTNSNEIVLQTCSLRNLKEKYLGYSISEQNRTYYQRIINEIGKQKGLSDNLGEKTLQKKRNLADITKNLSKKK